MKIIKLYEDIANLTFSECKESCKNIGSCCEEYLCQVAISYAKDSYGITLIPTGNLFSLQDADRKCIAPPHTRPLCSTHSCQISTVGFYADSKLTESYFVLRNEIDSIEFATQVQNS